MTPNRPDPAPALTPEEWKERCVTVSVYQQIGYDALQQFAIGEGKRIVPIQRQHAIAALALHGQSYGFNSEDLKTLDIEIEQLASYNGYPLVELRSLRDRIAALLPPPDAAAP